MYERGGGAKGFGNGVGGELYVVEDAGRDVVRDGTAKRKDLVLRRVGGAVAGFAADEESQCVDSLFRGCPTPGFGEKAWTKTHRQTVMGYGLWGHKEPGVICLCCGGLRVSLYV